MNDRDIVCLATTPNRAQVNVWRTALEDQGIECEVGEVLTYWINNVALPQADLWVHRFNVDRALRLLEASLPGETPVVH